MAAAVAVCICLPAAARAAPYDLDPDATLSSSSGWSTTPAFGTGPGILADRVYSPSAPDTTTGYADTTAAGPVTGELSHANVALQPGETVQSAALWVYAAVGSARTLTIRLRSGGSTLATFTAPSGQGAQWWHATFTGALSQAALDALSGALQVDGTNATTTTTRIFASYIHVSTDLRPAAPTVVGPSPAIGQATRPQWSLTGPPAATLHCTLTRGATTVEDTWCGASYQPTMALPGDGAYTLSVVARDADGTQSTAVTNTYTLDTTAPAAPNIDSAPSSITASTSAQWTFSGEPGATFACELRRDGAVVVARTSCSTPYTQTLTTDGVYTLAVQQIDSAGLAGPDRTSTVTLDRSAPGQATVAVSPAVTGSTRNLTYTFSAARATQLRCVLTEDGNATPVLADAPCTSPLSVSIPAFSTFGDGTYRMVVTPVSAAGVVGPSGTATYVLDTLGPAAPSVTSGPAPATASTSPAFAFTAEAGATTYCEIREGTRVAVAEEQCTSPWSPVLSQPDGTYTFRVHAVDAAGNAGPADPYTFDLDRAVPSTPSILSGPAPAGQGSAVSWTFSGSGAASDQCRLAGPVVVQDWGPCTDAQSFTADLSGRPEGDYTFSVRGLSRTGTPGASADGTYRFDRTAPPSPDLGPPPASPSADETGARWTFSGEAGATFRCRLERAGTVIDDWASCASPAAYTITTGDGTYDFLVVAVDRALNTSQPVVGHFVLDHTAPPVPAISGARPRDGHDPSPSLAFTGTAPAFECRVTDAGGADVVAWTTCSDSAAWTPPTPLPADGVYTFAVRGVGSTGVAGAADSITYRLDTQPPPAPVLGTGPASPTADPAIRWPFTGEAGATFECQARHSTWTSAWAPCTTAATFDLASRADGTWTIAVRATDAAQNTGAEAIGTFSLDRAAPPAPRIDSGPGPRGTSRAPEWTFSGAGARFECRLDRTGAFAPCPVPTIYDLTRRPDGAVTFEVRAVSAAEVAGPATASTYVLDTTGPAPPDITARPGASGAGTRPAWSFATEAGATTSCRVERADDGATIDDWSPCASPFAADLSGERDGDVRFLVRAADALGNQGDPASDVYRLDRVAPPAPAVVRAPPAGGADRAPTWSFAGAPDATFECRLDGPGGAVAGWAPCPAERTVDLSGAPDGVYVLVVRAVDAAGNRSAEARGTYALDTTPGAVRLTGAPAPFGRERAVQWSFAGGEPGETFQCRLDRDGAQVAPWAACGSPARIDLAGQPDGNFRFSVRPVDPAGNAGGPAGGGYVLDTTAPAAPVFEPRPSSGSDRSPTFAFTSEDGALTACAVDHGGDVLAGWKACGSPFTAQLAGEAAGTFRVRVRATDAAGNTGPAAARTYRLVIAGSRESASDATPESDAGASGGDDAGTTTPPAPVGARDAPAPAPVSAAADNRAADQPAAPDEQRAAPPSGSRGSARRRARRASAGGAATGPRRPAARHRVPATRTPSTQRAHAHRDPIGALGAAVGHAARAVASVVIDHPDKSVFPMSFLFVVLGFLGVQNRIDRSDPKLALAPVAADPDLEFPDP